MDRHCGNCKYFGEPTGKVLENEPFHRCNNDNSIFKACLVQATGCMKFEATDMVEPQEREDLGDYPDIIHDQFDNMTGSMNL